MGAGERGQHRVLAGHVVRGGQHVTERRPAQHPLVRTVRDRVGEIRAPAGDQRRMQRSIGGALYLRREPGAQTIEIDTGRSLRHERESSTGRRRRAGEARARREMRAVRRCGRGGVRRAGRRRAGSGQLARPACRRGSRPRRAPPRTLRPRSRTRGARGPSRGSRSAQGRSGRPRGPAPRASPRFGAFAGRCEEESRLAPAGCVSSAHRNGPVKTRFAIDSAAIKIPSRQGCS